MNQETNNQAQQSFNQSTFNTQNNNNVITSPKKNSNKSVIIIIIIVAALFLLIPIGIIIILSIFKVLTTNSNQLIYGKWSCNSGIELIFKSDKSFQMYDTSDKNNFNITGDFTIDDIEEDRISLEYIITMKSNNRTISGKKYTDDYSTKYSFIMDQQNKKELIMMNTLNYNMYRCTKK